MKIIRCDRCGKEIKQGETYWIIRANPTDPLGKPMFAEPTRNDLCNDCGRELGEWLHPLKLRDPLAYNLKKNYINCTEGEMGSEKHTPKG